MSERYERYAVQPRQLHMLLAEVRKHEWPLEGRKIKYVDLCFDNRTGDVFTIVFRHGGCGPKTMFTVTNRTEERDVFLFNEIMAWLNESPPPTPGESREP